PSAIAATGGMAQNYRGKGGSHYTSSLELAMRMIQGEIIYDVTLDESLISIGNPCTSPVALGTTVGLFTSSLVVYSFGTKKRGALWAF
ncbi:15553_t:CDS:1, partial [Acaulospora colombiana]